MLMRQLLHLRRLSTARLNYRPTLSSEYKSKQLWEDRFSCGLLGSDSNLIKVINNKIISGNALNNLEIDIFINIAAPRTKDISQLQEAVNSLRQFRKTINAHSLLPATSHALCRLFLDSGRLEALVSLLENRVEFGIFHDTFTLNLCFDRALEQKNYAIASKLASLIMLQEEFGVNELNDNLALYSLGKYIESQTDFADWNAYDSEKDPIFSVFNPTNLESTETAKKEGAAKQEIDEDEDEDEAEYIRIPFLRNPYFDNHFDLKHARSICGKSLSMLGRTHEQSSDETIKRLGNKCKLAGEILQANWPQALEVLNDCVNSKTPINGLLKDTLKHYLDNLDGIEKMPSDSEKKSVLTRLEKLPMTGSSLSEEAELRHDKLRDIELRDVQKLRSDIEQWSSARQAVKKRQEDMQARAKLIEEIKARKEELKQREQYLYFYDNLKKSHLTRIEYD